MLNPWFPRSLGWMRLVSMPLDYHIDVISYRCPSPIFPIPCWHNANLVSMPLDCDIDAISYRWPSPLFNPGDWGNSKWVKNGNTVDVVRHPSSTPRAGGCNGCNRKITENGQVTTIKSCVVPVQCKINQQSTIIKSIQFTGLLKWLKTCFDTVRLA